MIPDRVANHIDDGIEKLTSMFAGRKVIEGILRAALAQVQDLEDTAHDLLIRRNIADGFGWILDVFGRIVGEPRLGREDEEYKYALLLRVLINRSDGRLVTLLHIVDVAARESRWSFAEQYPASFSVDFFGGPEGFRPLKRAIQQAKPAGVGASIGFAPTTHPIFVPGSVHGTVANERGACHHADGEPPVTVMHVESL